MLPCTSVPLHGVKLNKNAGKMLNEREGIPNPNIKMIYNCSNP